MINLSHIRHHIAKCFVNMTRKQIWEIYGILTLAVIVISMKYTHVIYINEPFDEACLRGLIQTYLPGLLVCFLLN